MREKIIRILEERGYKVRSHDVVKNGITFRGITIGEGNILPTIYLEQFENRNDLEEVAEEIIEMCEEGLNTLPTLSVKDFMNWDYVKSKLQLCIQRKGNEDIVKRDFLDLEEYVRVNVFDSGTFKVRPEHLDKLGITEEELFDAAWDCTAPTVEVHDMMQMLEELGYGIVTEEQIPELSMIVATNKSRMFGAIAMKAVDKLAEIADRYETDLVILPSSIHEVLLHPVKEDTNFLELDAMVREVNATQVAPEEVLSNNAYRYNRDERSITYYYNGKGGKHTF